MVDYSKMDDEAFVDHMKMIASALEADKPATAKLLDEAQKRISAPCWHEESRGA